MRSAAPTAIAAPCPVRLGFVTLRRFTLLPFPGFMDVPRLSTDEGDRSRQRACQTARNTAVAAAGRDRR